MTCTAIASPILNDCNSFLSPYDIVFMDGSMPVLSGYDCVREIRQLGSATYIIACTSNSTQQEIDLLLNLF